MADSSLLPVIVGGLLTLAGGIIGSAVTLLNTRHQTRSDRLKLRGEKFEELVAAAYEYDHWLETKQNVEAFGAEGTVVMSPVAKLQAIAAVHFPAQIVRIAEMLEAAKPFELWISQTTVNRLQGRTDLINGITNVYSPYREARDRLLKALIELAAKEFGDSTLSPAQPTSAGNSLSPSTPEPSPPSAK